MDKIKTALSAGDYETAGDLLSDAIEARFPGCSHMNCGLWNTRAGGIISSGFVTDETLSAETGGAALVEAHNAIKRFIEETAATVGISKVEFSLLGKDSEPIEYGQDGSETLFFDIWLKVE